MANNWLQKHTLVRYREPMSEQFCVRMSKKREKTPPHTRLVATVYRNFVYTFYYIAMSYGLVCAFFVPTLKLNSN